MSALPRTARSLAFALGVCALSAPSALAQDAVAAAAAAPAPAPAPAPVGPTIEAARVGVRQMASTSDEAPQRRRAGYGQPIALMVVGGAAVLVGLIIGGGAGTAIAIGGAIVGLVGLYQYMQ